MDGFSTRFSLGRLDIPSLGGSFPNNRISARQHSDEVSNKIRKELALGRVTGPFNSAPNFIDYSLSAWRTQGTDNNRDVIQETVKELKDREERQDNVIIFNAPEPNTNLKEVRICEDTELVKNLCNEVCEIDIDTQNDIADVIRLGRKPEGEGKPRPLKVLMKNTGKKTQLFKNLWKLRDADAKLNCLIIQNYLTKKEREDEKKLVDEAKAKEASTAGNSRYRVRGPPWARRVVKLRPTPGETGAE